MHSTTSSKAKYADHQPVEDWSSLKNETIEVHIGGKLADHGRVDDVMPDGSMLWLMNNGSSGRRIITNEPGTTIRLTA